MANKDVAIPIVFPDYRIAVDPIVVKVPDILPFVDILPDKLKLTDTKKKVQYLGHAGILFIAGDSGRSYYYEYGRYDPPANIGLTRKQTIPDVTIGTNGRPTRKSLLRTLTFISEKAGQHGRIAGAYIELDPGAFVRMEAYVAKRIASNRNPKRVPYDLLSNSCLHFMKSVGEAGGARMPPVVARHPSGYIFQVQMQEADVELDMSRRLTVQDIVLE
jgi:hypothetical protein